MKPVDEVQRKIKIIILYDECKTKIRHSVFEVLKHDRQGSFVTRYDRKTLLLGFTKDLHTLGYKLLDIHGLKVKQVKAVIKQWQKENLAIATIKNRLSAIRQLGDLIHKPHFLPPNKELGIQPRKYCTVINKALVNPDFNKIKSHPIRISLELQRVFGLRREESLKIKPHIADKENFLVLNPSWCKGGRGRIIPIKTEEQRYWLERAKEIAGLYGQSLIPKETTYIRHRYQYDKQTARAGLKNLHGLRHAYAQKRYKELTGFDAPICAGLTSKQYTKAQKQIDHQARMILTEELGHSRKNIIKNYCN